MSSELASWKSLESSAGRIKGEHLKNLFAADPARFDKYSLQVGGILFDYSKNLVTDDILGELLQLARDADVEGWRERMFRGERINKTEGRPVLHVALRNRLTDPILVDGVDVMQQVAAELAHIKNFVESVRSGGWKGYTGKRITDVVGIGIGGSNLGPEMVTDALGRYSDGTVKVHYVSNVDSAQIEQVLEPLDPEQVLFVVSSKTFTTRETMINANTARKWLLAASGDEGAVGNHFCAVTSNRKHAIEFGLAEDSIFGMWDWVGGRYSLWSAIGLPIALNLGFDKFEELLAGARSMDEHFRSAPLAQNAPVIQALIGVWNSNFLGAPSQAILPYNHRLKKFPDYLQQADMESNGKSVDRDGKAVTHSTGAIIWGQLGINGQHAFYQLLHQGTHIVPADFIGAVEPESDAEGHHEYLMANLLAQSQALMTGIDEGQVREDLRSRGMSESDIEELVSHKVHRGNRPSNTFLLERIDPFTLGALIAMYEHKIFVQGIIWRVCSFDQWGVELGKELANKILPQLEEENAIEQQDSSTMGLLRFYKEQVKD